jgi:hypothetical protein
MAMEEIEGKIIRTEIEEIVDPSHTASTFSTTDGRFLTSMLLPSTLFHTLVLIRLQVDLLLCQFSHRI